MPCTKIRRISIGILYACTQRFTSSLSKIVEMGAGKVAEKLHCIGNRKKHVWAPLGRTPAAISPTFCVSRYCGPHRYSEFRPDVFRFRAF